PFVASLPFSSSSPPFSASSLLSRTGLVFAPHPQAQRPQFFPYPPRRFLGLPPRPSPSSLHAHPPHHPSSSSSPQPRLPAQKLLEKRSLPAQEPAPSAGAHIAHTKTNRSGPEAQAPPRHPSSPRAGAQSPRDSPSAQRRAPAWALAGEYIWRT